MLINVGEIEATAQGGTGDHCKRFELQALKLTAHGDMIRMDPRGAVDWMMADGRERPMGGSGRNLGGTGARTDTDTGARTDTGIGARTGIGIGARTGARTGIGTGART